MKPSRDLATRDARLAIRRAVLAVNTDLADNDRLLAWGLPPGRVAARGRGGAQAPTAVHGGVLLAASLQGGQRNLVGGGHPS